MARGGSLPDRGGATNKTLFSYYTANCGLECQFVNLFTARLRSVSMGCNAGLFVQTEKVRGADLGGI